jgi:uncharacterized OB-fold protein
MTLPAEFPRPVPDGDSRPYWEGLARGELLIQRCAACGRFVFYPRSFCPHCSSDQLVWTAARGTGVVYSYTVVHQAYGPFAGQTPFVVALIDLDEGVRMMARITHAGGRDGEPTESVCIGARVRVIFERIDDDLTLPYFALAE